MKQESQISRRDLLKTTGQAAGAALVAGAGAAPFAHAVGAAPARTRAMAPKKTVYSAVAVPTLWTTRSPQHPVVSNAGRILAAKFEKDTGIHIEWVRIPDVLASESAYAAWMTPRVQSGDAPDIISPFHNEAIQRHWAVPLDEYLVQPNPFAPQYKKWSDIYGAAMLQSLAYGDGHTYTAQLAAPFPGVETGLAINEDMFAKLGLEDPVTWADELHVGAVLKQHGSGIAPWPPEAKAGSIWPLALQLLVTMLQDVCPKMDLKKNKYIYTDDAAYGFKHGLIGPMTPIYKAAWQEMRKIAQYWIDGWQTTDLDLLWRQGKIGARLTGSWEFINQYNDPNITFKRKMIPQPYVLPGQVPFATKPKAFTAGDGKVPEQIFTAINGGDTCIIDSATKHHNNFKETLQWLQFLTNPENNGFLANEGAAEVPAAKDAPLAPIWGQVASFKLPLYTYQIAWWGQGLFFDATEFDNERKIFVSWVTNQIDDTKFFQLIQKETADSITRYLATLKK